MKTSSIYKDLLTEQQLATLFNVRLKFGDRNQISVSAEECCELAKELLKFTRYNHSATAVVCTKDAVKEEVADVLIVLNHVLSIFRISDEELAEIMRKKINRIDNWLKTSESMEITTKMRELE